MGRARSESVGKRPLDESGKDPVNEDGENFRARRAITGQPSSSLRAQRSNPENLSGKRFWIASALCASQ
jgi:hypothetical protein